MDERIIDERVKEVWKIKSYGMALIVDSVRMTIPKQIYTPTDERIFTICS